MTIEILQAYINGAMLVLGGLVLLLIRWRYTRKITDRLDKYFLDIVIFPLVLFCIWAALTAFINPIYYIKYL